VTVKVVGVSLRPEVLERLDQLARSEGVARSGMVARLVERAGSGVLEVRVDGRRFVPAREKKS
jgi:hypothetical protein